MGKVSLEDCMCPICMCILVEPVTMPCSHTLCMPCFKQNVEEASLTCPMCRTRISVWARRASKNRKLINEKLWTDIQSFFPDKVKKRIDGEDDGDEEEVFNYPMISIAKPGEIRQEYEEQLKRLAEQREKEQQKELEASEALIRKLQEEENTEQQRRKRELSELEKLDEEFAKELMSADGVSPNSVDSSLSRARLTRSVSNCSSVSATSSRPASTIETFLSKMREAEKLKEADRGISPYPYKCLSPTDKGKQSTAVRPSSIKEQLIVKDRCPSRISISSDSNSSSNDNNETLNYNYMDCQLAVSDCGTNDNDETLICNNMESDVVESTLPKTKTNFGVKKGRSSALSDKNTKVKSGRVSEQNIVQTEDNVHDTSNSRSTSAQSNDSISQELLHFRPIKLCPLTPPKKLASGKVVEPPLIRTTPRNLSKTGFGSPEPSLSDIDASSPIMQRRLSELSEERKELVQKFSKSTATAPDENIENELKFRTVRTSSFEQVQCKKNTGKVVNDCRSDIKLEFGEENNNFHDGHSASKISSKKLLIPLEANLHEDIDDFDVPPPLIEINNIHHTRNESCLNEKPPALRKVAVETRNERDIRLNKGKLKETGKRKGKVSLTHKKEMKSDPLSPQSSIRDYLLKGSKSCGKISDIFKETVKASNSGRDEVDGNVHTSEKLKMKQYGDHNSGKSITTLDRFVSKIDDMSEKGDVKLLEGDTFCRRRKIKSNQDPDFVWLNLSPKKKKKEKRNHHCSDSDLDTYDSEGEDLIDTSSDISSFSKDEIDSSHHRTKEERIQRKDCVSHTTKSKRLFSDDSASTIQVAKRRKIDIDTTEQCNKRQLKSLKNKRKSKKGKTQTKVKTKMNSKKTMEDFIEAISDQNRTKKLCSQEDLDRQFALKLERQFQIEAKMSLNALRFKGTDDQYNFRKKPKYVSS